MQLHHSSVAACLLVLTAVAPLASGFVSPVLGPWNLDVKDHKPMSRHFARTARLRAVPKMQGTTTAAPWQHLKRWADEQKIESSLLQLKDFGGGLRGMEATRNVKEGDILVAVPDSAVLRVIVSEKGGSDRSNVPKRLGRGYISEGLWNELEWWGKLAVLLMWEKGQGRKTSEPSSRQAWLDTLPTSMSTPLHWTEAELLELQFDPIIEKVRKQQRSWTALYEKLHAYNSDMDKAQFILACELVRSRAFSGPYVNKLPKDQLFLTGLLVAISTQLNIIDGGKAALGAGAVVLYLVGQSLLLPSVLGLTHYVIAPVIDMVNHQGGAKNEVSFQAFQSCFEVQASSDIPAGEQVMISYGTRSNDQLLQYYGFVEADNKDDVAEVAGLWQKLQAAAGPGATGGEAGVGYISWEGLDSAGMEKAVAICGSAAAAKTALRDVLQAELDALPTTLQADLDKLALPPPPPPSSPQGLALAFRIQKKKLLAAAIASTQR